jgi:hypothetical protein
MALGNWRSEIIDQDLTHYQTERRQYPRYRVNLYTQIITPKFYISLNTIEISIEGIRIETYSEIPPGTEVTITFDLDKKILFFGKVVWVLSFQQKGVPKYLIGIKVHEILLSGIKVIGFDPKHELIQDILKKMVKASVKKTKEHPV